MISGFNTDLDFEGVTYHIQTEDKGLDTPILLSLVYTGGEILASKRSSYEDLVETGFDETMLAERLHRQHKLICAAILAGRIDDLKRMTERDAATRSSSKAQSHEKLKEAIAHKVHSSVDLPVFETEEAESEETAPTISVPITNIVREVVPDFAVDKVDGQEEVTVSLIDEVPLRGGDRVVLKVLVSHGNDEKNGISSADVLVKVLGSTFRPLIFQSRTGPNGVATIRMQLPHFTTGRAAVLIRATTGENEVELRRIISQG